MIKPEMSLCCIVGFKVSYLVIDFDMDVFFNIYPNIYLI